MNVVFVGHCDFLGNSAMHIFSLANELAALGVSSLVCVPGDPATVSRHGVPRFRVSGYDDAVQEAGRFPDGRGPDLVHAWTPRECVRTVAETLSRRFAVPCVVHLEDNEEVLLEDDLAGVPFAEVSRLPAALLDQLVPVSRYHPRHGRRFIAAAAGVTALMDRLLEAAPARTPTLVFWPGYDEAFDVPGAAGGYRRTIGVPADAALLVYTGNVHASNAGEVTSLVLAVHALRRRGRAVVLAKTGTDFVPVPLYEEGIGQGAIVDLGFLPREDVPRLVHDADVLVQPGRPGRFNDYRFPSKLPEFLVSGRPVVLPATNVGRFLQDGAECVLLHEGHALEIAARVEPLLGDAAARARIGAAGREFARRELRWPRAAAALRDFYDEVAARGRRSGDAVPVAGRGADPPQDRRSVATAPDGPVAPAGARSGWPVRLVALAEPPLRPAAGPPRAGRPAPAAGGSEARAYGIERSVALWRCDGAAAETLAADALAALTAPDCLTVDGAPAILVRDAGRVPAAAVAGWREFWAAHGLPAVHLVACRAGRAGEALPAGFDAAAEAVDADAPPVHVSYPLVAVPAGPRRAAAGRARLRAYEAALRGAVAFAMTRAGVQAPLVVLEAGVAAPGAGAPAAAQPAAAPAAPPAAASASPGEWDETVLAATRRAWSGGMRQYYAGRGLPVTEKMMVDALVAAEAVPTRSSRAAGRLDRGPHEAR